MPTFTAYTTLPGPKDAEALGEALEALSPKPHGVGVFEIEDGSGLWEVAAYFTDPPDPAGLALLATIHGAADFAISELPETDWVAKVRRELAPVKAGRFFVYGSHDAELAVEAEVPLLIEAAMAFGTGHHGTTQGCLEALEFLLQQGVRPENVADIGCGTAVLAMAAAKVLEARVIASDIDAIAVEVAQANVAENGLEGRIEVVEAAGFNHGALASGTPYDLIFANILKGPLIDLAPDMATNIAPGGHAILSGILTEQAAETAAIYHENGFNTVKHLQIVDWSTLILSRNLPRSQ